MALIECLSQHRRLGLEEISRLTGLAKPTALRFLSTLRVLGYARRDQGEAYYLTLKTFMVGSRALEHIDIIDVARPEAERLCEELGETVHLGMLDGDHAVYVLKVESRQAIRMYSRVGRQIPLHCTAIGKVLLAGLAPAEYADLVSRMHLDAYTPATLGDRAALDAEVERVRVRGYALDAEEREEGIRCLAAPVRDYSGAVAAALSVSWPSFRYREEGEAEYARAIRRRADAISEIMGGQGAG
jgi:IclR family KDG regulon transcriptional repressor